MQLLIDGRIVFCQQPFEEQSRNEPTGRVVQPDHFGQVPAGMFVVPRAQVTLA